MRNPYTEHAAELHGRRLVVCSELKPDDGFDEGQIRLLASGKKIRPRRIRRDSYSFRPTHHLWLLGNHPPEVSTRGLEFWRRTCLVPFTRTVPPDRCIDNLAYELVRDEGPGILCWLIDDASQYLSTPDLLNGPRGIWNATTKNEQPSSLA
ncbi:hypothetical protein ACIQ6Y_32000 [Streptomyces sp. NPDC096205]|uniref:hypothetical protein n=1 Tax=Streptomyces sp. NPDC096205 TaxID=3366081 RepID=UPI00382D93C8